MSLPVPPQGSCRRDPGQALPRAGAAFPAEGLGEKGQASLKGLRCSLKTTGQHCIVRSSPGPEAKPGSWGSQPLGGGGHGQV